MWTTKISFDGTINNLIPKFTKKYNVRILIFPLSWTYEKNGILVNITGVLYGETKEKKKFIKEWRKTRNNLLLEIELNNDFFVATINEHIESKAMWNKNLIFTEPLLIDEKGHQIIIVNSFEKKHLETFISTMEKFHDIKIHYIKNKKAENISFKFNAPSLTEKQKSSLDLAVKNGYYEFPRKTSIKKLAKISKLSFTAFHSHLRKAEQKLIPFLQRKG